MKLTKEQINKLKPGHYMIKGALSEISVLEKRKNGKIYTEGKSYGSHAFSLDYFLHTDPIEEMEPFKSLLGGKVEKVAKVEKSVNPDFFDKLIENLEWYAKAIKENFSDDIIQKFYGTLSKGVYATKNPVEFVELKPCTEDKMKEEDGWRKINQNGIPEFKHYSEPQKKPEKSLGQEVIDMHNEISESVFSNNAKDERLRERCIQYIVGKKPATHPVTSIIREANEIYEYIKKGSVK